MTALISIHLDISEFEYIYLHVYMHVFATYDQASISYKSVDQKIQITFPP